MHWGISAALACHFLKHPVHHTNVEVAHAAARPGLDGTVVLFPPVPLTIQRVANVERAQTLVECASRGDLQRFLAAWQPALHACRNAPEAKGLVRWAVDVDPLTI